MPYINSMKKLCGKLSVSRYVEFPVPIVAVGGGLKYSDQKRHCQPFCPFEPLPKLDRINCECNLAYEVRYRTRILPIFESVSRQPLHAELVWYDRPSFSFSIRSIILSGLVESL